MNAKGFRTGLVSRLTGLTYKQIDRYDRTGLVSPEIQKAAGRGSRRLYSRTNLIELGVLKKLLDTGVSLMKIRRCLAEARRRYPAASRPLHDMTFRSDGLSIYIDDPENGTPVDMLNPQQPVFPVAVEGIARQIDRAVERFESHRIESLRVKGRTYLVEIVNDTETHGLIARCPDLYGVSVKGPDVEEALRRMKDHIVEFLPRMKND